MQVTWLEALGLIGVTLVVSRGKVFDGLRRWLKGFVNPFNPFRLLGELMSCAMCSGFWVGLFWGLLRGWDIWPCVTFGGFVSVTSFVADSVTGLLELACNKAEQEEPLRMTIAELARVKGELRKQRANMGIPRSRSADISEEEAEAIADEDQRIADESVVPREVLKQYEKVGEA
jgi:hypothetical protein